MNKKLIICITVLLFSELIYAKGEYIGVEGPDYPKITQVLSLKGDNEGNVYLAYVEDFVYLSVAKFDGKKWSDAGERKFTGKIATFCELYDCTDEIFASFTVSNSGIPYVAFASYEKLAAGLETTYFASVMKYDASADVWKKIGKPAPLKHATKYIAIGVNSKEVPYVAFSSCSSESCERINEDNLDYTIDTTSVMKFDGSDWVYVGEPMFTYDPEKDIKSSGNQIIFDSTDTPYVSFFTVMNLSLINLSLFKFNGSEWQIISNTEYSKESPAQMLPFIDREDNFYYMINGEFFKFDGKELTALEVTGEYYFPSAEIDGSDVIYSASSKSEDGEKRIQVKKYVNEKWENIGDEGYLVNGSVREFRITVDNNSLPYFAYMDSEGPKLVKYDPEAVETPDDTDDDISDEDSVPVNDKDSNGSGCGIVVM